MLAQGVELTLLDVSGLAVATINLGFRVEEFMDGSKRGD